MKIKTIEINNYKAFYGKHKLDIGGKNVFIYGENGSGKSSLYYALKDFFQSSIENINLNDVENIFIPAANRGQSYIKVQFRPDKDGNDTDANYEYSNTNNTNHLPTDTSIRDGNKLKSFLTYKHLLGIHYVQKNSSINLFDLLVKGVLKHYSSTLTGGRELGELWAEVERVVAIPRRRGYDKRHKGQALNTALTNFNTAFRQLFIAPTPAQPNPEYLLDHARPILNEFDHGLGVNLIYREARVNGALDKIERNVVDIELTYGGQTIQKPHLFLNEARLSAIAISIYFGMIKRHPQLRPCKILFLDDIFIGLDIGNRLPLLNIIDTHFPNYQVFITTYDRPWYEFVKSFLGVNWKTIEFYATPTDGGYEVPRIINNNDYLARANQHLGDNDYKSAAVYARTAFEKIVQDFCDRKGLSVKYHKQLKKYTSEDFWNAMKTARHIPAPLQTDIEQYRDLVLNAFSHYNTAKHQIRQELTNAIAAVNGLKTHLDAIR